MDKWPQIIKKYPEANFLQSPSYAKMNEILGDPAITEIITVATDSNKKSSIPKHASLKTNDRIGYMLMIVRNAKRGRYLEIPCGPLIDWQNPEMVAQTFTKIRAVARAKHCVFVRLRPQLPATPENLALMERLGLKKAPMHLAAEHTVMIDLSPSEEQLLSSMRRQTRYEVRRADKQKILVTSDNSEAIFREFHQVQVKTAKRQNFVPPSLKMLLAEREAFNDHITIYQASTVGGEAIAYGLVICDGLEGDYYEAASTALNRKLPGAYAILWQAMRDLKAHGYQRFNLWGIAPPGQPHHRYAGVTTFKTGFGGEIIEYVPAHDLVISKMRYLKNLVVEETRKKRRHLG